MNGVQRRNASAWLLPNDGSRTNHRLRRDMRRFDLDDAVDIAIIGCGAGGSVLAQRLARRGWDVVALDAGPFWDPDKDWVSDEAGSHQLYWNEPRVSGADPVELGNNNSGRGVGGSMVHFAGYAPRFHPSDFRTFTNDGVGADWPIDYHDLKAYYGLIEAELPVAGQHWPWGDPHGYPHSPHPMGANGLAFQRAALAAGSKFGWAPSPFPMAASGTALTASTAVSACRGARSMPRRLLSSPTSPTPWRRGRRSALTAWSAA